MTHYFTAADVTHLNEFALLAKGLTASLTEFRKTIDLRGVLNQQQADRFDINTLTHQATMQADIWLVGPRALGRLHGDFQQFIEAFVRQSEHLMYAPGSPDSFQFFDLATIRTNQWLRTFNHQQESMIRLTTVIYNVLPRLIDYMRSSLYIFAGRQNKLSDINNSSNIYMNAFAVYRHALLALHIPPDQNNARQIKALNMIESYESTYALSYAAASNLTGYFTRLRELTAVCAQQAAGLRYINNSSRLRSRINILLISLTEIQRMSATANGLFQGRG